MHNCGHTVETRPPPSATLRQPRWQSVWIEAQVFRKNCVNSLLKCEKKKRPQADAFVFPEQTAFAANLNRTISTSLFVPFVHICRVNYAMDQNKNNKTDVRPPICDPRAHLRHIRIQCAGGVRLWRLRDCACPAVELAHALDQQGNWRAIRNDGRPFAVEPPSRVRFGKEKGLQTMQPFCNRGIM